jgi:AraC-like DNA-binding protein
MHVWDIEMVRAYSTSADPMDSVIVVRDGWCTEPLHTHQFIEIEYIISGTGKQNINGKDYFVKRGDVLFLNIGDSHSIHSIDHLEILNCVFLPQIIEGFEDIRPEEPQLPKLIHLSGRAILEAEDILFKIEKEHQEKKPGYRSVLKSYIAILITLLFRFTYNEFKSSYSSMTAAILNYLEETSMDTTLYETANHFNFNPSYFSRLFKKNVGISFSKYIKDRRIKTAVDLLLSTEETVASICNQVGINDQKQFYALFREYSGMTPGQFRKIHKKPASPNPV